MIYQIQVTNYAESDLRNIYEYIAFTLLEPATAVEQLDRPILSTIMTQILKIKCF